MNDEHAVDSPDDILTPEEKSRFGLVRTTAGLEAGVLLITVPLIVSAPLIHYFSIPTMLVVTAAWSLGVVYRWRLRAACPRCGAPAERIPIPEHCGDCGVRLFGRHTQSELEAVRIKANIRPE